MSEPWDLAHLPSGIVDPADRYRVRDTAQRPPRPPQTAQDARIVDSRAFARNVIAERARLALVDPGGEREALVPVDGVRARQRLLTMAAEADRPPATPWRRGDRLPDGRELLTRLGADPTRDAGRVPCPAHGGRDRNLAWRLTPGGTVLLKCHSHQCSFAEIVAAVA